MAKRSKRFQEAATHIDKWLRDAGVKLESSLKYPCSRGDCMANSNYMRVDAFTESMMYRLIDEYNLLFDQHQSLLGLYARKK